MTLFGIADRVQETSITTGTGTITLAGAIAGYQSFLTALGADSPCCYVIQFGSAWETGVGVIHTGGYLSRETVLASSNANAAVNLTAGTKSVFISRTSGLQDAVLMTAGETISIRDAVIFDIRSVFTGGTKGVLKGDARKDNLSKSALFMGFALHGANPTKPVLVRHTGIVSGFSGLDAGARYYISTTPGAITSTNLSANDRFVGVSVSSSELVVQNRFESGLIPATTTTTSPTYGFFGQGLQSDGGSSGSSTSRGVLTDFIDLLTSVGNAGPRGSVEVAVSSYAIGTSANTIYMAGGAKGSGTVTVDSAIQTGSRNTFTGNLADAGDLTVARGGLAAVSGSDRSFFVGGLTGSGQSNVIDLLTFSTFSGATSDAGDLLVARSYLAGAGNGTSGFFAGGFNTDYVSQIDVVVLATGNQNSTDRGDLVERKRSLGGVSASGTAIAFIGGYNGSFIANIECVDFFNYSSIAMDRGELTLARSSLGTANNGATGAVAGGTNGVELNVIENIQSNNVAVNVSDRGDLTYARHSLGGN